MARGYDETEVKFRLIKLLHSSKSGISGVEISEKLGINRVTMSKYLNKFAAEGTITQKNIGIQLRVTPRINEKSKITLLVDATVEALLSAAEINTDQPRSTNRTVKTQVTVTDGDTVIIGGLIAENILENKKYVPVLSDIPFIGRMFQSTQLTKEQRELLIFITPNVVGWA